MEDLLKEILERIEVIRICSLIMAGAIVLSTLVTVTIKLKDEVKSAIANYRRKRDHIGQILEYQERGTDRYPTNSGRSDSISENDSDR